MSASDRSVLYFSCIDERIAGRLDDWMRNKLTPTPTDIQSTTIGGAEAAIGAKPRGAETGLSQIRHVIVRNGSGICFFNLLADGPDRDRRIDEMVAAARSFHILSDAETAGACTPIVCTSCRAAMRRRPRWRPRMPYADFKLDRLLTLNGVDDHRRIRPTQGREDRRALVHTPQLVHPCHPERSEGSSANAEDLCRSTG